jgi:hypothetical protein
MSRAQLVIDVQESCTRRPYFRPAGVADFLVARNELIAGALGRWIPVGRVLQGRFAQVLSVQEALRHAQAD